MTDILLNIKKNMDYEVIVGELSGTIYFKTGDHHIYRRGGDNGRLECYLKFVSKLALKINPDAEKCPGNTYRVTQHLVPNLPLM